MCFYQKVDLFKIYRVGGLEELLIASRVEFWYANLGIFFQYRVAVVLYFFWFYNFLILV